MPTMPKSKLKLSPLKLSTAETFGQRLARLRKERGFTQVELAKKTGLTQALITGYECDRLRMHADMVSRFALALGIDGNEILGLPDKTHKPSATVPPKLSLKLVRRLQRIEALSDQKQKALLHTIDMFLEGSGLRA